MHRVGVCSSGSLGTRIALRKSRNTRLHAAATLSDCAEFRSRSFLLFCPGSDVRDRIPGRGALIRIYAPPRRVTDVRFAN